MLGVYDPSGSCLLYEQQFSNLNLTANEGVFSVNVGTPLGSNARTANDPGLSMDTVFANAATAIRTPGTPHCPSGYLPNAGDNRNLQITLTAAGGTSLPISSGTITSGLVIASIPAATVSETLQGIAPSGFLQPNAPTLTQATVAQLTSGGDASTLHNHDSLYAQLSAGGSLALANNAYFNLGTHTSNPLGPTLGTLSAGAMWFNSTTNTIQYFDGTTIQTLNTAAAPNNYATLGIGGTLNPNTQLEATVTNPVNVGMLIQGTSGQTADLLNITNSSGTLLDSIDPTGKLTASSLSGNGSLLTNINASNLNSGTVPLSVLPQASSNTSGYLSSTDWNTFNNKLSNWSSLSAATIATALGYTPLRNTSDFMSGTLGVGGTVGANTQLQSTATAATNIGLLIQGAASQTADLFEAQNNSGTILTKVDSAGNLWLPANPTQPLQACTKQYVDNELATAASGVLSFNTRTGSVSLGSSDVTTAITYNPLKNTSDTMSGSLTVSNTLGVGGEAGANTQLESTVTSPTNVGLVIQGAGSQSADFLDLENNTGSVLSKFDSGAMLTLAADPTAVLGAATKHYVDNALGGIQATGNYITALSGDVSAGSCKIFSVRT
jgi:hypothetical protein